MKLIFIFLLVFIGAAVLIGCDYTTSRDAMMQENLKRIIDGSNDSTKAAVDALKSEADSLRAENRVLRELAGLENEDE